MQPPPEKLSTASITDIMQTAYIDYSMSVIISRALPDARDGLKPVQRRILYAMYRLGLLRNRPFNKCAKVVGEVLGNYHPHGDASVYDTLVRLAQTWVMRYPLINPQGNFGSVDGDSPAAYRYTEARLEHTAESLLADLDEDTVNFIPNYNEETTEPSVLPSGLPSLLMNGSTGIAVGMATNIPPHNLHELIAATTAIIDNPAVTLDELCALIQGPDFPTGGIIAGREGILSYLKTGRGIVRIRGRAHTEENKTGEQIVITEIPYNVNRANLVAHIAALVTDKQIEGIRDVRDESDENTRVVIELKRGEQASPIINQLFKKTALENTFGVILLALDKKRPKQMNIKELLECFIDHRREVVTRRTQYRLAQAEARAHILEGYKIALDNLDDFVRIIRASASRHEAREKLLAKYPLTDIQADAILELRLYQLTGLERDKIEAEYLELLRRIEDLRDILENEPRLREVIKTELLALKEKHGDPRKTEITGALGEFRMEDVIPNEGCVITVSHHGFIKRTPVADYRSQRRGGKGVIGTETYEDDFVERLFTAQTHDYILFITTTGQCYAKKVYEVPEGARTAKGKSVNSFLMLKENEKIAAMLCVADFDGGTANSSNTSVPLVGSSDMGDSPMSSSGTGDSPMSSSGTGDSPVGSSNTGDSPVDSSNTGDSPVDSSDTADSPMFSEHGRVARATRPPARYLVMATKCGTIKKTILSDYTNATRADGLIGINLDKGDTVIGCVLTTGQDELILVSHQGLAVRFREADPETGDVLFRSTGRATAGVTGMRFKLASDYLEVIEVVDHDAKFLVASEAGLGVRTRFEDYRLINRGGTGVVAINLPDDNSINLAGALSVHDADEIMLLTSKGQSVRCPVDTIRETNRGAKGVKLLTLAEGDKLLSIAKVVETQEEQEAAGNGTAE